MTMSATTFRLSERIVDTSDVLFNLSRMHGPWSFRLLFIFLA